MRSFICFAFLVLAPLVSSVDHDVFRTCNQSDFCSRLRTKPGNHDFTVDDDSVKVTYSSVSMLITNSTSGQKLNLTITTLANETFRVTIDDAVKPRYRVHGALEGVPFEVRAEVVLLSDSIAIYNGDSLAMAHATDLSIDFYKNNALISVLNQNGRFTFEDTGTSQAMAMEISFPNALRAYGIPEHGDKLALRKTEPGGLDPYRLYNLDVAFHELQSPMALYGSIPVLYAHAVNHTTGIFFHNAAEQWVEINNRSDGIDAYFMAEGGMIDLFVLTGGKPKDAVTQYALLVGTAPLPQLWTLGYHQCRWNYDNTSDVKNVIANLDRYDFPVDTIWLDIEYTDGKRYFTWDPTHFTDPIEMLANLSSTNRKLVVISDPHIKVDSNYFVYKEMKENGYFVKNPDGSDFEGDCWPGLSSYVDFFNRNASNHYSQLYHYNRFNGTNPTLAGIWNDMNEPSVFDDSLEKTFPKNLIHEGGIVHRDVHNIYGLYQTRSTYDGLVARDEGRLRPFVLTRAHFAGSQRYTAVWTGDNTADWPFLHAGFQMCLSEALAGISFCGADVGGFFNNPDHELVQRWYQAGIWLPFFRAHANQETDRREPYLYPEDVQRRIRAAIKQRYAHIPMWYTEFYEYARTGEPMIRPLFYQYPEDVRVIDIDDQLLIGSDIMVRVIAEPGITNAPVYFPGGNGTLWYDLEEKLAYPGLGWGNVNITLDRIPVYYKSGSIITRKDNVARNTYEMRNTTYNIYVFLNYDGVANGTIYLDDMESFNYQLKQYRYMSLKFKDNSFDTEIIDIDANYPEAQFQIGELTVVRPPANFKTNEGGVPVVFDYKVYKKTVDGRKLVDIDFLSPVRTTINLS